MKSLHYNWKLKIISSLLIALGVLKSICAQETNVTSQIGITINDNLKINDDWRLLRSQTLFFSTRLKFLSDDITNERNTDDDKTGFWENAYSLTSVSIRYRMNNKRNVGIGYQVHARSSGIMHRLLANFNWREPINESWRYSTRFRYQKEWLQGNSGWYARDHIRIRARIQFRKSDYVRPYIDGEATFRLNESRRRFDRFRTGLGMDFRIKKHTLRIEYNYQVRPFRETNRVSPGIRIRGYYRL